MISLTSKPNSARTAPCVFTGELADQYRALARWLQTIGDSTDGVTKTIGLVPCSAGAGASTVAWNLAALAGESRDRPVLLLDASGSQAGANAGATTRNGLGLQAALSGAMPMRDCVSLTAFANVCWLGSEGGRTNPLVSATADQLSELLQSLQSEFEFIVVDLPSTESSLCFTLCGLLSGVLLTMESESTRSDAASRAKQRLVCANANLLGVVLNKYRQHLPAWLDARI